MTRIFFITALLFFSSTLRPTLAQETVDWQGLTMGPIEYHVRVVPPDSFDFESVRKEVADELLAINALMSTYVADSEVSRFNASDSTDWFPVSDRTFAVIERAQEISDLTGGAFDITVQPLVKRWNFGPDRGEFTVPSQDEVDRILATIGYRKLTLQRDPPAIRKSESTLQIDLSAIAKGYAVDRVTRVLERNSISDYAVEIGGEVRCAGRKPNGSPWIFGIESPLDDAREPWCLVAVDGAMATSGDYRNFLMIDGKRYSHEIDPKTGWPVTHELASASIYCRDCMTADALATAAMVLGREPMQRLAKTNDFEVLLIDRSGDGFTEWRTDGFPVVVDRETSAPSMLSFFIGAFVVMGLAIAAMAVGAIFGNKPIRGSCGGIATQTDASGETSCSLCARPTTDCVENQKSDSTVNASTRP